jgi:hypothetical protein
MHDHLKAGFILVEYLGFGKGKKDRAKKTGAKKTGAKKTGQKDR